MVPATVSLTQLYLIFPHAASIPRLLSGLVVAAASLEVFLVLHLGGDRPLLPPPTSFHVARGQGPHTGCRYWKKSFIELERNVFLSRLWGVYVKGVEHPSRYSQPSRYNLQEKSDRRFLGKRALSYDPKPYHFCPSDMPLYFVVKRKGFFQEHFCF